MFDYFDMAYNYEDRKVANYTSGDVTLFVDTARVTDSSKPYETAISHPKYNHNKWVIVELYDTKEEAQIGHDKWVALMTAEILPEVLIIDTVRQIKVKRSDLEAS